MSLLLSEAECRIVLDRLRLKTLWERSDLVVAERRSGYADDPEIARLQAKVSIMLELAVKAKANGH